MERTGLFVRLPAKQAAQLDRAAAKAGMRKQDFVSSLIEAQLVTTRKSSSPVVSSTVAATRPDEVDAVLTLDEVAVLLRVDLDEVLARATAGDLPGRRIGGDWRFSRDAVFEWLHGSDGTARATGFRGTTS
jgi:excisionase family DNA binding protein